MTHLMLRLERKENQTPDSARKGHMCIVHASSRVRPRCANAPKLCTGGATITLPSRVYPVNAPSRVWPECVKRKQTLHGSGVCASVRFDSNDRMRSFLSKRQDWCSGWVPSASLNGSSRVRVIRFGGACNSWKPHASGTGETPGSEREQPKR